MSSPRSKNQQAVFQPQLPCLLNTSTFLVHQQRSQLDLSPPIHFPSSHRAHTGQATRHENQTEANPVVSLKRLDLRPDGSCEPWISGASVPSQAAQRLGKLKVTVLGCLCTSSRSVYETDQEINATCHLWKPPSTLNRRTTIQPNFSQVLFSQSLHPEYKI